MTIEDVWNQLLKVDLIPIFEVLALSFVSALILIIIILGGTAWYTSKRK